VDDRASHQEDAQCPIIGVKRWLSSVSGVVVRFLGGVARSFFDVVGGWN
jgi:hypothetical protein